jgi:hypothetical protein
VDNVLKYGKPVEGARNKHETVPNRMINGNITTNNEENDSENVGSSPRDDQYQSLQSAAGRDVFKVHEKIRPLEPTDLMRREITGCGVYCEESSLQIVPVRTMPHSNGSDV